MTQQQLAELSGVSRQTINVLERNKVSASLEVVFKMARVFGASIEDIFLYEGAAKGDSEGENPYQDGVTIHVICADSSGGSLDNLGEEL